MIDPLGMITNHTWIHGKIGMIRWKIFDKLISKIN